MNCCCFKSSLFFRQVLSTVVFWNKVVATFSVIHLSPEPLEGIISVVLRGIESLTSPTGHTNPSQVSPQQTLVLIFLPRKDGKMSSYSRKESYTNIQISVDPRVEPGTLCALSTPPEY